MLKYNNISDSNTIFDKFHNNCFEFPERKNENKVNVNFNLSLDHKLIVEK